eukprot:CAMPEP_0115376324 /NCGR_PEP_ID=MMETSP0271-20121206/2918_1 /TAXON_ID=71861 /ORGANISM="Scrippsiella trochoidea, Strain CCMP3099" /LENGTH=134 /DNA_ID=CAMNT_0002799413 /DNA_START=12 /DNA_END=412 /DNA_ORIENTATION=+
MARQQALDALRQFWAPQRDDFEAAEQDVMQEFSMHATSHQYGEKLLSRADLLRLLGVFPLALLADDAPAARRATQAQVCAIYDEVLAWQAARAPAAPQRGPFTKGLTFESLRLVLLKVVLAAGLHFRHLVDDAV